MQQELEAKYDVPVLPFDCQQLTVEDIYKILEQVLYEFPIMEINVRMPGWIQVLEKDHWLRRQFEDSVKDTMKDVKRLRDMEKTVDALRTYEFVEKVEIREMNLGLGTTEIIMDAKKDLFYKVLSEISELEITSEKDLLELMGELTKAKKAYDKVAQALEDVQKTGYGIVPPQLDEMTLEEPEIVRQGSRFGVRLGQLPPQFT